MPAARAYLHPVMGRPNLKVITRAMVSRIIFNGKRAEGVEFSPNGTGKRIARAGEVIVCSGAFGSPQLLQLSGVGNPDELSGLGIDVVAELPGVGENLQDHLEVDVQYGSKLPVSVAPALKWRNRPMVGAKWLFFRLPADRDPLRRVGPGGRARVPGAHRADVLRLARHREDHLP